VTDQLVGYIGKFNASTLPWVEAVRNQATADFLIADGKRIDCRTILLFPEMNVCVAEHQDQAFLEQFRFFL